MAPICIKAPAVIALADCEETLTIQPFRLKKFVELKRNTKEVKVEQTEVGSGKVLIHARLIKNVEYERQDGLVGSRRFEIPFICCVDVPGAFEGDWVQIESAEVVLQKDFFGIPPRDLFPEAVDIFEKFWEMDCIRIIFKVLRDVQITVDTTTPDICPGLVQPC